MSLTCGCLEGEKIIDLSFDKQPGGSLGVDGDGSDRVSSGWLIYRDGQIKFKNHDGSVSVSSDGFGLGATFTHSNYTGKKAKMICNCNNVLEGTKDKLKTIITAGYTPEKKIQMDQVECIPPAPNVLIPYRTVLVPSGYTPYGFSGGSNVKANEYTPVGIFIATQPNVKIQSSRWISGTRNSAIVSQSGANICSVGNGSTTVFQGGFTVMVMSRMESTGGTYVGQIGFNGTSLKCGVTVSLNGVILPEVILEFMDSYTEFSWTVEENYTSPDNLTRRMTYEYVYTPYGSDPGYIKNSGAYIGMISGSCPCTGITPGCVGTGYGDWPTFTGSWSGSGATYTVVHTRTTNKLTVGTCDVEAADYYDICLLENGIIGTFNPGGGGTLPRLMVMPASYFKMPLNNGLAWNGSLLEAYETAVIKSGPTFAV
jgi:hypothetical protein